MRWRRQPAMKATHDEMESWRIRCLAGAGLEDSLARDLAREPGVDLHAFLELLDRGCPPALAARIVAPLEHASFGD